LQDFPLGVREVGMETPSNESPSDDSDLEQIIVAQAVATDPKQALLACFAGRESRRWKVGELFKRLSHLGMPCSEPAIVCLLAELELELALCPWAPWTLTERGTEWTLNAKNAFLDLLSGVRKVPGVTAAALSEEHRAVLLVVIAHRRAGGVSRTRIKEVLRTDPSSGLEELRRKGLVYTATDKEVTRWRPTSQALLALGLRTTSDIPELSELECWFASQRKFESDEEMLADIKPVLAKTMARQARRQRREAERQKSVPLAEEEADSGLDDAESLPKGSLSSPVQGIP
jgi:chromosome segregation and condensation protein ScpB